jgi:hypothetical protein
MPLGAAALRAVTRRTTVLPLRTVAGDSTPLGALLPAATPVPRPTGGLGTAARGSATLRPAVLPLRTVPGRPVTLRAPVLPPAGTRPGRMGALRLVPLGTPVLPLRTVPGRPVTLRAPVLPLRTVPGRPVTLRAPVLPPAGTRPGRTGALGPVLLARTLLPIVASGPWPSTSL